MNLSQRYKTWIEISRQAISNNIKTLRSVLKKTKIFAVVKSNAYGHGLLLFSKLADDFGIDGFCVDSVVEGHKLRFIGIKKPILVLGPTLPSFLEEVAADDIILSISNFDILKTLTSKKTVLKFHIKIDTGMHRQGFYPQEIPKVINLIKKSSSATIGFSGIYSHLASAKDVTYPYYTFFQLKQFKEARGLFIKAGFKNFMSHLAATGAAVLYPQTHFDMARIGIGLYGYWPSKETAVQHQLLLKRTIKLKPILRWLAVVSEVKYIYPGDYVGYDLTERITKKIKAAVIPVGYWHGFSRNLSSIGQVLINSKRCRVIGRVSMDFIVVEIPSGIKVKPQDRVVIIGSSGKEFINAEEAARLSNTTHYEILTRINPLIRRVAV